MTQTQNQNNCNYYVDLNIDNSIRKSFNFNTKDQAYNFIINNIKNVSSYYTNNSSALISALLYTKNVNNKKHVLFKKNLTKVFFDA